MQPLVSLVFHNLPSLYISLHFGEMFFIPVSHIIFGCIITGGQAPRKHSGRYRLKWIQVQMNSTKVQNPRRKMQYIALLTEPKTPMESSVFI